MNYIVLDLEWNQPIDGIDQKNRILPFEIIEVGAIKLNAERKLISEFSQIVKPTVYKDINRITGKLLHIKMEELKAGKSFTEVMELFFDWCGEDYIFCTWGPLDLIELQRNMEYYALAPLSDRPFRYYDVQKLFSIAFEDKKIRRSLEFAVDYLQIKKDIPFHRAFSDAYYTSKVVAAIDTPETFENYSYDTFHLPASKNEEIHTTFSDYTKYISREFPDKAHAIIDWEVLSTRCCCCDKMAKRKIKWFSANTRHLYSVSWCEQHGYVKGKIRLRKSERGGVYVIKTMKLIDQAEVNAIYERQEKIREHRRASADNANQT